MNEQEITALAREYAEEGAEEVGLPNCLQNETFGLVVTETECIIKWLLRRYYLVEKEEVRKEYEPVKDTSEECNYEELSATWDEVPYLITFYDMGYKCGQKETIESLFPEIAKKNRIMTIKELGEMADEYAKEIAPDSKNAQTAISADSFGFLDKVMEKCCLVEKCKVIEEYRSAKRDIKMAHREKLYSMLAAAETRMALLKSLFPEIIKD